MPNMLLGYVNVNDQLNWAIKHKMSWWLPFVNQYNETIFLFHLKVNCYQIDIILLM